MLILRTNPRRLVVLAGLSVVLALIAAPTAVAAQVLPDGGSESDPQLGLPPGAGAPAPVVRVTTTSLDGSDVALSVAFGVAAFALTAAALSMAFGRRRKPAGRSQAVTATRPADDVS